MRKKPSNKPATVATPPGFGSVDLQPKLKIGESNDKYEQEADRVADEVMRMPERQVQRQVESVEAEEKESIQAKILGTAIQRQTAEEEDIMQTKPSVGMLQHMCTECEKEEKLQRYEMEEEEEEEIIQTKSEASQVPTVSPSIHDGISRLRQTDGSPLPNSTRAFMEPRFGHDFINVKIHTGSQAVDLSRSVNARAFTVGRDIFFNHGEYQPGNKRGKELLAHELTHVVQQTVGAQPNSSGSNFLIKRFGNITACQRQTDKEMFAPLQSKILSDDVQLTEVARGGSFIQRGSGSVGRIKRIQKALLILDPDAELGETGIAGVDGDFGTRTETAVKQFQSLQGLVPDGIIGARTLKALDRELLQAFSTDDELADVRVVPRETGPQQTLFEIMPLGSTGQPAQPPVIFKIADADNVKRIQGSTGIVARVDLDDLKKSGSSAQVRAAVVSSPIRDVAFNFDLFAKLAPARPPTIRRVTLVLAPIITSGTTRVNSDIIRFEVDNGRDRISRLDVDEERRARLLSRETAKKLPGTANDFVVKRGDLVLFGFNALPEEAGVTESEFDVFIDGTKESFVPASSDLQLLFNGTQLILFRDGKLDASVPAASGRTTLDVAEEEKIGEKIENAQAAGLPFPDISVATEQVSNKGPIPDGDYFIRTNIEKSSVTRPSGGTFNVGSSIKEGFQRITKTAAEETQDIWGTMRIKIETKKGKGSDRVKVITPSGRRKFRSAFYIHSGSADRFATSGCIKVPGGTGDRILEILASLSAEIPLRVQKIALSAEANLEQAQRKFEKRRP